MLAFEVF